MQGARDGGGRSGALICFLTTQLFAIIVGCLQLLGRSAGTDRPLSIALYSPRSGIGTFWFFFL